MVSQPENVTQLLKAIQGGDEQAKERLFRIVYDDLRRVARNKLARERPGATLQATDLVNEAYLRMVGDGEMHWQNRAHFFGTATQAMWRILVDRARRRKALKHGGARKRVEIEFQEVKADERSVDLLALDEALEQLDAESPRRALIVKMRHLLGLTVEECAATLGVSTRTVDSEYRGAREWLARRLAPGDSRGS